MVILILLVMGMVYLLIKIKQIMSSMQKVDNIQKKRDLHNNEPIDKTTSVLANEGDVHLAQFSDQIILNESSTLETKGP